MYPESNCLSGSGSYGSAKAGYTPETKLDAYPPDENIESLHEAIHTVRANNQALVERLHKLVGKYSTRIESAINFPQPDLLPSNTKLNEMRNTITEAHVANLMCGNLIQLLEATL